jgi:hypothetical protein
LVQMIGLMGKIHNAALQSPRGSPGYFFGLGDKMQSYNCLTCAKLKRENERLQAEVTRQAHRWNELKKWIISQEQTSHANQVPKES